MSSSWHQAKKSEVLIFFFFSSHVALRMGLLAAGSSSLSYQDQTEEEESLCCLKAPQCSLVDMHTWMNAHTQTHMHTHVNMAYIKHMQDEPHTHIQTVASCTCASTNAIEMLMPEDKRDGKSARPFNPAQFIHKRGSTVQSSTSAISLSSEISCCV